MGLPASISAFNAVHGAARSLAVMAFSQLKGTWRILNKVMWRSDKRKLPSIILLPLHVFKFNTFALFALFSNLHLPLQVFHGYLKRSLICPRPIPSQPMILKRNIYSCAPLLLQSDCGQLLQRPPSGPCQPSNQCQHPGRWFPTTQASDRQPLWCLFCLSPM
ncbi:unnamed protein product [Prunus armeniaca]